jgi:hypothetical protein
LVTVKIFSGEAASGSVPFLDQAVEAVHGVYVVKALLRVSCCAFSAVPKASPSLSTAAQMQISSLFPTISFLIANRAEIAGLDSRKADAAPF